MKKQMLPELMLRIVSTEDTTDQDHHRDLETHLSLLDEAEFSALTAPARCGGIGGGGCSSPSLAKWYVMFCPTYGQN